MSVDDLLTRINPLDQDIFQYATWGALSTAHSRIGREFALAEVSYETIRLIKPSKSGVL